MDADTQTTPPGPTRPGLTPLARAIGRSLRLYHEPGHAARLDAFHRRFLAAGELAFDIGAHVGDRTASFRRLGARAVAVEPQPRLARALRLLFARDPGVAHETALVGAVPGLARMWVNIRNPTVSTASTDFIAAARGAPGWEAEEWDHCITRPVTTLDALAARHGRPAFAKIDVEGFEAEVLRGLTFAPRTVSVEFTLIQRDVARDALALLAARGYARFNACIGEMQDFIHPVPLDRAGIEAWLATLPPHAGSGDIYASTEPHRLAA